MRTADFETFASFAQMAPEPNPRIFFHNVAVPTIPHAMPENKAPFFHFLILKANFPIGSVKRGSL
jgi:hypothetical protein